VLAGQKWHHPSEVDLFPEVGGEVSQVLLFVRTDGIVGHEHEPFLFEQPPHGMMEVDPDVDRLRRIHAATRGPDLHGDQRGGIAKAL